MTRQNVTSGTVWEAEVGYSRAVRVGDRIEVSALVDPEMLVEIEAVAIVGE